MTDFDIWLAWFKTNIKVGLILLVVVSPIFIWYVYDTHKRIKDWKKKLNK